MAAVANVTNDPNSRNRTPKKRASRPGRPNYKYIHRFPLPLTVHPLPPLIPHNPLSVISIALSYLTYFISPPQHELYSAYFDSSTSSVHVTDPKVIRALWTMGFFGKGSLSRSEPTWLEREKKRKGLLGVSTSEENTGNRRVERREWKLERARKEREAIAERLRLEAAGQVGDIAVPEDVKQSSEIPSDGGRNNITSASDAKQNLASNPSPNQHKLNGATEKDSVDGNKVVRFSPIVDSKEYHTERAIPSLSPVNTPLESSHITDEEHLQLSNEEAFFLVYGLGALQIYDDDMKSIIPASSLLPLFRRHSYFPTRDQTALPELDDRFMVSYVAYHHFRSRGWVVRSGVKFGVDLLLYNRGPVFSHAEFAVVLMPAYEHPYWTETEERRAMVAQKQNHTWWWLHCVNRVQAQVKKSLILCYVEIPPPTTVHQDSSGPQVHDIGEILRSYKVRELNIRRWIPNRSRD